MANFNAEQRRKAIRAFMQARGLNVHAWSKAAGLADSTLRNFLDGLSQTLTDKSLQKLANAANRPVAEMIGVETAPTELPLWGYAGAGEMVHPFDGDEPPPIDTVEAPPGMKNGAALIVRGDSMLPRLQDGDVIFFEMREVEPARLLNEECVVRVKDGGRLVKRLTRGTRRNRFHLVSINPAVPVMEDQAVEWAAAIQWIRRRQPKR